MRASKQSKSFASIYKQIKIALYREADLSSYTKKVQLGLEYRPHYALGLLKACNLAKKLNIDCIYALEFGCAGGSGIQDLLYLSKKIQALTGVKILVKGMDLGEGLCKPESFRDLPYMWDEGFYKCDYRKLKSMGLYEYIMFGDVSDTLPELLRDSALGVHARIGFMSFDMDYYSSTKKVLDIISSTNHTKFLPRTPVYFDDTLMTCQDTGELRAIHEFNQISDAFKIHPNELEPEFLSLKWRNWLYLAKKIMTLHFFNNEEYVSPEYYEKAQGNSQLPL